MFLLVFIELKMSLCRSQCTGTIVFLIMYYTVIELSVYQISLLVSNTTPTRYSQIKGQSC